MTKPRNCGNGLGNGDEIEEFHWIMEVIMEMDLVMKVRLWRWIRSL